MNHPKIIQGGMGAGVSDWRLARAVSVKGGLGVVSGTALDVILARRLFQGDADGSMRRALAAFPDQSVASEILTRYFRPEGTSDSHEFPQVPLWKADGVDPDLEKLTVVSNFVEVYLAKEGHSGVIGVNYLEKISMPNPAAIYGAMLAGTDYILMGAGIPLEIPGLLDAYASGSAGTVRIQVEGAPKDEVFSIRFEPSRVLASPPASLKRPLFLAIVSSYILAATMASRATGRVDGIVVENHTAGGHNAPPRGVLSVDENGEPVYGPKDTVDYAKMVALGLPFWLGGSWSNADSLEASIKEGACGIQVGTLFAFCTESGLLPELKRAFLESVKNETAKIFTHPFASPTGYPFKIGLLKDTLSGITEFTQRQRVCNIGCLREMFRTPEGKIGYRCPAERVEIFKAKGGLSERTEEARCLCNALLANIGLGMKYAGGYLEKPLLTVGAHLESLREMILRFGMEYTARDVMAFLHGEVRS